MQFRNKYLLGISLLVCSVGSVFAGSCQFELDTYSRGFKETCINNKILAITDNFGRVKAAVHRVTGVRNYNDTYRPAQIQAYTGRIGRAGKDANSVFVPILNPMSVVSAPEQISTLQLNEVMVSLPYTFIDQGNIFEQLNDFEFDSTAKRPNVESYTGVIYKNNRPSLIHKTLFDVQGRSIISFLLPVEPTASFAIAEHIIATRCIEEIGNFSFKNIPEEIKQTKAFDLHTWSVGGFEESCEV